MNYYSFHIGDYAVRTRHLSPMEDLAYRRMLDLYYTRDGALPSEPEKIAHLIGLREHAEEVRAILCEFFSQNQEGLWFNERCDEEIAKTLAIIERAKNNGKGGGRPKKTQQEPARNPAGTRSVSSGNPAGTQQEPSGNPAETRSGYPLPITQSHISPPTPPQVGGAVDNFEPEQPTAEQPKQPRAPRRRQAVEPPVTVAENPQYLETKARLAMEEAREYTAPPAAVLALKAKLPRV